MNEQVKKMVLDLTKRIEVMKDDAYLSGHLEWMKIANEAIDLGEYVSSYDISSEEG